MAVSTNPKTYTYHVSKNGVYKGDITKNVISDFAYQQEINSAGTAMTIVLGVPADNFGEGTLVDFNNDIKIYEIDDQNPNGILIFNGYMVNYKPIFSDQNQESVEITVMGYGATLNDYIIESGESVDVNQNSQNGSVFNVGNIDPKGGGFTEVIQSFTTGGAITKLSAIQLTLAAVDSASVGSSIFLQVLTSQADAEAGTSTTVIASATLPITDIIPLKYKFTFATAVTVSPATVYWMRVTAINLPASPNEGINIYYDSTNPYSGGILESITFNGVAWSSPVSLNGDAYILTYSSTGSTQSTYSVQDPAVILKSIIDNYNAQGGKITYTSSSIDLTGISLTYTFNCNTVFEGIQKCADMAPVGWYWYIDQVNNVIHFHALGSKPTHTLTFGKNIKNLAVEKRSQDLVNVVYFVGGPTGGINLYQKYVQQTSIDTYGRHALRYNDNNVTLAATAQVIANAILTNRGQVELRIDLDILDDGGNSSSALGFDLESITLGEIVSFRSLGPSSGGTLWDVAKWDQAKWDFDITDLSSVQVQVTKVDYKPDILHLSLSTVPPDVTKRVEYIYRNLIQVTSLSNPSTPS